VKVCGSCKWFELIREAVGNCGNPSISRRMIPTGDKACLAFNSKDKESEAKEKKDNDYKG
jgi:hypothetical protein